MSITSGIPEEIIIDILYQLPAKSISKFRCVSKKWLLILTNPIFVKTHLNNNLKNTKAEKLIIANSMHTLTLKLNAQNVYESRKLNIPSCFDHRWIKIIGSANGLISAMNVDDDIFLINPTTSKYHQLPRSTSSNICFYGFGYDDCSDDFKVVKLQYSGMRNNNECDVYSCDVYSLKGNCWRSVPSFTRDYLAFIGDCDSGVFLHGAIHWIAYTTFDNSVIIFAFDLTTDEFREVAIVAIVGNDLPSLYNLVVLEGCLCLVCDKEFTGEIDIWIMKAYGVRGSWIKLICHSSGSGVWYPQGTFGDRGLVLSEVTNNDNRRIEIYDVKEKRCRSFIVDGAHPMCRNVWIVVDSLVSPFPKS